LCQSSAPRCVSSAERSRRAPPGGRSVPAVAAGRPGRVDQYPEPVAVHVVAYPYATTCGAPPLATCSTLAPTSPRSASSPATPALPPPSATTGAANAPNAPPPNASTSPTSHPRPRRTPEQRHQLDVPGPSARLSSVATAPLTSTELVPTRAGKPGDQAPLSGGAGGVRGVGSVWAPRRGPARTTVWWSGSWLTPACPSTHEPSTQPTKLNNGGGYHLRSPSRHCWSSATSG
jgi:hypothetical protein